MAERGEALAETGVLLSVVIPTHRRPAALARLIESLSPQLSRTDREAVVINDGTHDAAYQAVAERFAERITYLASPTNRGQSAARNEAAGRARGRWIVFTDDDCVTPTWWLDWLEALLADAPDVDVVGGTTHALPGKGTLTDRFIATGAHAPKPEVVEGEPALLITSNMAVRRDLFLRHGGFDERLRSGEDRDFTHRLRRSGARFLLDRSWHVLHDYGGSLRGHLKRFHHYGYWMPFQAPVGLSRLNPRRLPESAGGWALHVWHLARINRMRWRGRPDGEPLFPLLGLLTELAMDIGYLRGCRAFADPARRQAVLGRRSVL